MAQIQTVNYKLMKKEKPKKVAAKKKAEPKKKVDYDLHMKGMPEFNQPELAPVKTIMVCFASNEDMHKFSKIVGQLITAKTRSIYYPELKEVSGLDKRWSK